MARLVGLYLKPILPMHVCVDRSQVVQPKPVLEPRRMIKYSFCTNFTAFLLNVASLSAIAVNVVFYVLYFLVWDNTLVTVKQENPGSFDLEFFRQVVSIICPVEFWLTMSVVAVILWISECIIRKVFQVSPMNPIASAIMLYLAAVTFCGANAYLFLFHEFIMNKLLAFQDVQMPPNSFVNVSVEFFKAAETMLNEIVNDNCTFPPVAMPDFIME